MAIAKEIRQRRLTVVDDSPEVLAVLEAALRTDGAEVAMFGRNVTLHDIQASDPDLLVIDLRLGAENLRGLQIIRRVRSHPELRHVPIIVCSAALDAITRHEDELHGIADLFVLAKPFSLEDLEARVEEALGEPREAPLASCCRREPRVDRRPIAVDGVRGRGQSNRHPGVRPGWRPSNLGAGHARARRVNARVHVRPRGYR